MPGPIKDSRQEAFCQNSAKLMSDVRAYKAAYKCTMKTALANAWRVRELEGVTERIAELRKKAESATVMDMRERREWMARNKRVDLLNFNAEIDGDLVEEITIEPNGKKRIKIASKRACIMDDARLAGDLIEKIDHTTDGQPLPSVAPQITIEVSPHWNKPRTGT